MAPFFHLAYSPWVQKLGGALLHSLWQGALVAALMALVLRLLRQHNANARYLVACGALLALGVCPVATLLVLPDAPVSPARSAPAFRIGRFGQLPRNPYAAKPGYGRLPGNPFATKQTG